MKAYNILSKAKFAIYVLFQAWKPTKIGKESGNVLLAAGGHIGDILLEASAWKILIDYYKRKKRKIFFFAPLNSWNILQKVIDTESISFIEGDCCTFNSSWSIQSVRRL